MTFPLFASLGEILGDPALFRWYRGQLHALLNGGKVRPPPAPPAYFAQLTPLGGTPPDDSAAIRALWTARWADDDRPSGGALALAGMALYSRGINLSEQEVARCGLAALLGEAETTLLPSGVWGEDSTMRHLQLTATYAAAWLLARRQGRPERVRLEAVVRAMLDVIPALRLPGGLPAIGDWPDNLDPGPLQDLLPHHEGDAGWLSTLLPDDRAALLTVRDVAYTDDLSRLERDGWLRLDSGPWSGLWHVRPDGWLPENGGGHHDLGSFELHHLGVPVFVDAGGPPPGRTAEIDRRYRSAALHNGIAVDGNSPTAVAHWRYDAAFCRAQGGPPPRLRADADGPTLVYDGFRRLGGPTQGRRHWSLAPTSLTVVDVLQGTGRRQIERRLVTPLPVSRVDDGVCLEFPSDRWTLRADAPLTVRRESGWTVEGAEIALSVIMIAARVNLPWQGRLHLERTA